MSFNFVQNELTSSNKTTNYGTSIISKLIMQKELHSQSKNKYIHLYWNK